MNPKDIIKVLLLIFVIFSICFLGYKEFRSDPKGTDQDLSGKITIETAVANASEGVEAQQVKHLVIAYYFHTTYRCPTCRKIEKYTKQAIMDGFSAEIKNGSLLWKTINVEEKPNEHFIKDYQLFTKAVIVVDMKEGKQVQWKNLKDIWQLVGNKDAFTKYIQGEVSSYLEKS